MNAPRTHADGIAWYEHLAEHLDEATRDCQAAGSLDEAVQNFAAAAAEARGVAAALRKAFPVKH